MSECIKTVRGAGAIEEVHDRPMEIKGGGGGLCLDGGGSASFSKQAPNGWDVCQTTDGTIGQGGVAQIRHYHNHHRGA